MSKGGGEETTTTAEIPEEFKQFIFGAPPPSTGGGFFSQAFQPPDLTGGFGGVIPEALDLFGRGALAPEPIFGDVSQQGQAQQLDLASLLSGSFLPQLQETFSSLGPGSETIADFATQQLQDQLERDVLPSLSQAAINAGQFGSSRQGIAEGIAQSESARNIAGIRASILQQGAQQQLAFAPQLAQLLGLPAGIVSGVGAQQDVLAQGQQGNEFQNLLRLAQLIQGFIPGATQTTITEGGGTSALGGAAGGALTGASLGSAIPVIGTGVGAGIGGLLGLLGFL